MSALFRAADEAARLPSSIRAMIASISPHHRAIQEIIEDLERARRAGADMAQFDDRLGAACEFAAHLSRQLTALRTGDMDAVKLADLDFLKRFAPAGPARLAAE
ncbi:hypothetical protein DA075_10025 [Methylobacterium currus]|uniref:Uncharacterized protein n=1 Tax=Methylobacterium currus TaxID=2051553 RepID=A0A2R4WI43_9HYPH|nr:hypothetical protein [Methylobacterium currus]AWB21209.1 hypothetical protein DA075_10025 [Methylobacterium currus]